MNVVRVLAIKAGETKDADGREVGDDWQLADLGADQDDTHYYVTADGLRASDLADMADVLDPEPMARFIVDAINARVRKDLGT